MLHALLHCQMQRVIKDLCGCADESLQCNARAAHGSSSASEEDTLHPQGPSRFYAGPVEHLQEHALSQSHYPYGCLSSYQPSSCLGHTGRGFSSSSRVAQHNADSHRSSRAVYGITSPHVVAALNPEQRSAGSSFCSMRGFASMPDAALQRDSQHYTGRVTQSGRGFASSSEPAQQSAAPAAESAQQPFIPPGRIHNAPAPPWTPTCELRKRNFLPRRMGHLMEVSHTACLA